MENKQPQKSYTDKERNFSIKYPKTWKVFSINESKGKQYGTPFLFIFQKEQEENYKKGEGMGPNVNIGYIKLKQEHSQKDFELQLLDLPNSVPGYQEINNEFNEISTMGKVEGVAVIGELKSRFIQYYYYPNSGDPVVITSILSDEEQKVLGDTLETISKSFKFTSYNKQEKAEEDLKNVLESQEADRVKRLDKIVVMQRDLARKRIKYNFAFIVISLLTTVFMVLIGMPLWIGVLFFVGIFFALRHFYLGKMLINKYNSHVKGLYKDKQPEHDRE